VLEHVVKVSPESAEAHAQLSLILANEDQYEEAAREMGLAVQQSPNSADYAMRLAEILILWKHYPTALEFLAAVKDRFGKLVEYQYKLGLAYYGMPRIPQAIAVFDELAKEHPELDLVQFFLGNCYQTTGDFEKAEPHYKRAIELNSQQASYYAALAQMLRKGNTERSDEALIYLEKALALDPKDMQSKLELALCYERKANYPKAQSLLEEVIQQQPDSVQAHVTLARVYYRQKKKEEGDRVKSIIARLEAEQQARKSSSENRSDPATP
jgi:tetratricopeptide (TPR) repeat protein